MTELTRAHPTDAGFDLKATNAGIVSQEGVTEFRTGVMGNVPPGAVGLVFGRSGLGVRYGVTLANSVGVIDAGYKGEIILGLTKVGDVPYSVKKGDRIAQIVYVSLSSFDPSVTSERGTGGFGSSGR